MVSGPDGDAPAGAQPDPVSAAQSRAAHAYAGTLLAPEIAAPAAEDAIAAFRQTLSAGPEADGALDAPSANAMLLALTRLMTAVSMPDRSSPEDRRQAVWASVGSASHCTCRESAALLATRANGNIEPRESAALDEHLATCADCRQLTVASVTADSAFYAELKPAPVGGFGLLGVPRAAYAVAAVIVAAGIGVFALSSGGSSSAGSRPAADVQDQNPTNTSVSLPITTAATPPAAHPAAVAFQHQHQRRHERRRHATAETRTHTTTTAHTTTARATTAARGTTTSPSPTHTRAASSATPPSSTAAATTGASMTPTSHSSAGASHTPSSGNSSAGAGQSTTPSSAAVVSGQSSLPADSAPQQGIGNLTTTTP